MFCILQSTVWGGFYLYFVNTDRSQAIVNYSFRIKLGSPQFDADFLPPMI
jgi:hypothetical protein